MFREEDEQFTLRGMLILTTFCAVLVGTIGTCAKQKPKSIHQPPVEERANGTTALGRVP